MAEHNEAMKEEFLREDCNGNKVASDSTMQEIKLVLEVAMLCTKSRSSDRPSVKDPDAYE